MSSSTRSGVDCDRGGGSFAGGRDDLCAWVGDVARDPDACNARGAPPSLLGGRPAVVVAGAAELDEQLVVRHESRWDEQCVEVDRTVVVELDAVELILDDADSSHRARGVRKLGRCGFPGKSQPSELWRKAASVPESGAQGSRLEQGRWSIRRLLLGALQVPTGGEGWPHVSLTERSRPGRSLELWSRVRPVQPPVWFSLETEVVENARAGSLRLPVSPSAAKGWSSATAATESADHASRTRAKIPLQIRYDRFYEPYAPLNLSGVVTPWTTQVKVARRVMADQARSWPGSAASLGKRSLPSVRAPLTEATSILGRCAVPHAFGDPVQGCGGKRSHGRERIPTAHDPGTPCPVERNHLARRVLGLTAASRAGVRLAALCPDTLERCSAHLANEQFEHGFTRNNGTRATWRLRPSRGLDPLHRVCESLPEIIDRFRLGSIVAVYP